MSTEPKRDVLLSLRLWRDPLGVLTEIAAREEVGAVRTGAQTLYVLTRPEHVTHVLHEHWRRYPKARFSLRPLLGDGLTTSEGEPWRRQRRLMQPAFHQTRIAKMTERIADCTAERFDAWRAAAKSGQTIDLAAEMVDLTLHAVVRTLLGGDTLGRPQVLAIERAVVTAFDYMNQSLWVPWKLPRWMPTAGRLRFKRALAILNKAIFAIIADRRKQKEPGDDLLQMLIDATDEQGKMSDQQLRDEVMTMFVAGHQTTASALSWTWYLLGRHPESARAVREEVRTVLAGRTPQFSDLPRLAVTKSVIEETMRLYPPAWFFTRVAAEDGLIGGRMVPAGGVIAISPYVIHRNPATWSRPDAFDPTRFQKGAPMARCAYMPFGDGAHMCIGNSFAMAEMQLIVAMMMQAFEFTPCSQRPVAALPRIVLSPRSTLDVRVAEARG